MSGGGSEGLGLSAALSGAAGTRHALSPPQAPVGCGEQSSLPRARSGACLPFNLMSHLEIKRVHLQKAAWQGLHACFSVLLPFKDMQKIRTCLRTKIFSI